MNKTHNLFGVNNYLLVFFKQNSPEKQGKPRQKSMPD